MSLEELESCREIQQAMGRYARALDSRNWALLDTVFDPAVQGIYAGQASAPGRTGIVAGIRSHLDGCGPSQHLMGNFTAAIHGDEAESQTYIRVFHIGRGKKSDVSFESFGEYDVRWRRTPDGWRAIRWELKIFMNLGDISILGPG